MSEWNKYSYASAQTELLSLRLVAWNIHDPISHQLAQTVFQDKINQFYLLF